MAADMWLVFTWWGIIFLVGAAAFPLTKKLFRDWYDQGYLFTKAVGLATVSWIVYVLGTLHILSFSQAAIIVSMVIVFLIGIVSLGRFPLRIRQNKHIVLIFLEEIFFLLALLFWSWVKGHEPSIHGLEKFMDYGFMKSILESKFFPPPDMWYAGKSINYYYFGHLVTAVVTKLSGLDLSYTFNLMLATPSSRGTQPLLVRQCNAFYPLHYP
ncbi:hypothetical protein HY031_01845 [Candidatus Gottesmanbacteria bacterium]|nr:hypothetical protein [Candidatus Gottesmanbacteria bacterium]